MALSFAKAKGTAQKGADSYKMKDGENIVRLVGGILPRYIYWIKSGNSTIPVECLAFSRDEERFNNAERDWVPEYFPDLKCSWAYAIKCIDPTDGKVKVLNLKKKLLEQILNAAEDLGDPTDPDTGWPIHFKKTKTGPLPMNVSYDLQVLRCKPIPLTEEERKLISEATSIDEDYKRPTPEEVKNLLEKLIKGETETTNEVKEHAPEFEEDIPY